MPANFLTVLTKSAYIYSPPCLGTIVGYSPCPSTYRTTNSTTVCYFPCPSTCPTTISTTSFCFLSISPFHIYIPKLGSTT